MEEFKKLENIYQQDEGLRLFGIATGQCFTLDAIYTSLSAIRLSPSAPEKVHNLFNVAKNLALYSWFSGGLAAMADMQGFVVVERALKMRFPDFEDQSLKGLFDHAVEECWIMDQRFSHVECHPMDPQAYSRRLKYLLRKRRNNAMHGDGGYLDFDCIQGIQIVAEIVNQLFPDVKP